jgi:hypothetical protein
VQRHSQTRFPLVGGHRTAACRACHTNQERNEYAGVPTDCYSCHRVDFEATLAPAHAQAGFGTDCVACHKVDAIRWGSNFDHATTGFPLTGAHRNLRCAECHAGNGFAGGSADCNSCHQQDYASAQNPPHSSSGFPTTCQSCHSTTAWQPASFNHASVFPLTGAHASVQCAGCHQGNRYAGTPADCYSCHQQDFTAALDPPHASSGFSTACQTCHTTTGWQPSTFQHDQFFPISAGTPHSPTRWNACSDCHPSSADFRVFSCTNCHLAATMNPKHSGVNGYQFANQACYTCHPRGRN